MRKALLAASITTVLIAGCDGDKKEPAITRLPGPYIELPAPSPPPPPPVVQAPPPRPAPENWDPPNGVSRRWRYIVIHHSASDIGSLGKIDQWHRDKGWEHGCGYHFVIGNGRGSSDGKIEPSPRWKTQEIGAHTRLAAAFARQRSIPPNYYNENGVGVVLVGNYDRDHPSPAQMASLARVVRYLMDRCNIPETRVVTHGGVDQTHCPGKHFSRTKLLLAVRALRAS